MNNQDPSTTSSPVTGAVLSQESSRIIDLVRHARKTGDSFENFVSRVGVQNNNTLSAGTYNFNLLTRNRILLEAAYRGSWIVGAVIDSIAEDMTRAGIDITTSDSVDLNVFTESMTSLEIMPSVQNLIKWGRLYGGCIAVMQIDGQDLSTPLRIDSVGIDQFKGLVVFDRWQLNPVLTPVITSGPKMGLPKYYQIVSSPSSYDPSVDTPLPLATVHYSRIIRYTGIDLPFYQAITEMMWGESVLERLWDRLISFDNSTLSSASLIDRANLRTVKIDRLREIIAAGGDQYEGLIKQFDAIREFQTNEGLTLLDKEDEMETTSYTFAGLSDMMLQFGQQLSGACGIPLIRLFSQSPAGLGQTGESDIRMYYDGIKAKQEGKLRDPFSTLLKVMWRSVYGKPAPKDLGFTFTPLWQMSAVDKANVAKTTAETVIGTFESGLTSQKVAMTELKQSSGEHGLFSSITEKDINAADEETAPLPDEATGEEGEGDGGAPSKGEPKTPVKALDALSLFEKFKIWLSKDAGFKESDHPRKDNGEFGSGGGGGGSTPAQKAAAESYKDLHERLEKIKELQGRLERIKASHENVKKLRKAMNRAINRADSAPDRNEKDPASLRMANLKVKEYNEAAEAHNKLLDQK